MELKTFALVEQNVNSFQQSKDTLLSYTDALLHLRYHNDYYSAKTLITTLMK